MKLTTLSLIPLSLALFYCETTAVYGQENKNQDLNQFCENFPYNKKCKDFFVNDIAKFCVKFPQDKRCIGRDPLVSLENRKGESFYCSLMPRQEKSKKCKVSIKDEKIIIYQEKGKALEALKNQENTEEIIIELKDVFSFNSPWWIADVEGQKESVGMFADIQVGYFLKKTQEGNKSNFIKISASKDDADGFSNENIPQILEQLEPWLYHNSDIEVISSRLKLSKSNTTNKEVATNIQILLDTKECPQCNLTGADLEGADLERANLEGANLEGATLEKANVKNAYLVGANLSNANLHKANFENSVMLLANFNNSDLGEANLQATNLKYSTFKNAEIIKAKLDGDGLNRTQLQNTNFTNANLTESNLKCADLSSANLTRANLTKANLERCTPNIAIRKGDISSFLLNKAKVSTPLGDTTDALAIIGSVLSILQNPTNINEPLQNLGYVGNRSLKFIGETNLINTNLSGANLTETKLKEADLFNSNLTNATLNSTDLEDADLSNVNLMNAQITDLELESAFLCNTIMPDISINQQGCIKEEEVISNR